MSTWIIDGYEPFPASVLIYPSARLTVPDFPLAVPPQVKMIVEGEICGIRKLVSEGIYREERERERISVKKFLFVHYFKGIIANGEAALSATGGSCVLPSGKYNFGAGAVVYGTLIGTGNYSFFYSVIFIYTLHLVHSHSYLVFSLFFNQSF